MYMILSMKMVVLFCINILLSVFWIFYQSPPPKKNKQTNNV